MKHLDPRTTLTTLALLLTAACGPAGGADEPSDDDGPTDVVPGGGGNGPGEDYADVPPPGSLMVFATKKLSSEQGYSPVGGGVSWEHEDYGVVRWVEGMSEVAVITTEHNSSYGHSDLLSVVSVGDALYRVKSRKEDGSACASTTCGRKTIHKLDPLTGDAVANCEPFDSKWWYLRGQVAILEDSILYRTAVEEDFQGNWEGGGFLERDFCDGNGSEIIATPGVADDYVIYGAGQRLIGIRHGDDPDTLVELDPATADELAVLPWPVADPSTVTIASSADDLYAFSEVGPFVTVFAYDWNAGAWATLFDVDTFGEGSVELDGNRDEVLLSITSGPARGAYFFTLATGELRNLDLPTTFLSSNPDGYGEFWRAP